MHGSQVLSNQITIVINKKGSDHIFIGRHTDVGKGGLLQWRCKDKSSGDLVLCGELVGYPPRSSKSLECASGEI